MKKVSREQLINDYERVAAELDKRPTLAEYNDYGEYSSTPIYKRFGSFEDLKAAAGFERGRHSIPSEALIDDLLRVAEKIDRTPPVEVYEEHGEYNSKTLKNRFGNWNQVLSKAGLAPTEHSAIYKNNTPEVWDSREERATVEFSCDYCGETSTKRERDMQRHDRHFCSRTCKYAAMEEESGPDARSWSGGYVTIECELCGDKTEVRPSVSDDARFCSQACMIEWRSSAMSGEGNPRWRGGTERYYGPSWIKHRHKALERDERTCQSCGMEESEHIELWGATLDVHHITPASEFEDHEKRNALSNLVSLCKKCHTSVETGAMDCPTPAYSRGKGR